MSTEKDLSSQDVDEMMKEADLDHNGQLDYKEWFRLFTEPINLPNK
jgi:Ca2+-binding EF-hand superfamily protein